MTIETANITLKCTKCTASTKAGYLLRLDEEGNMGPLRRFYIKVETPCAIGLVAEINLNDYLIVPREIKTEPRLHLTNWLEIPEKQIDTNKTANVERQIITPIEVDASKRRLSSFVAGAVAKIILASPLIAILGYFLMPPLIDRLTPVDVLTERIYNREVYKFSGAKCNDGSIGHSQGSGTCSWHDGVNFYFDKGDHKKSIEDCHSEALDLSWLK
jgi:hypothetical protein